MTERERERDLEGLRFKGGGDAICLVIYLVVLRPVMWSPMLGS